VRVLHVLPHRGGGAETYIDMLERLPGFQHRRFALSAGRTPVSALGSIPVRWPQLALGLRSTDLIHVHGDMASVITRPVLRTRPAVMTGQGLHMLRRVTGPQRELMARGMAGVISACRTVICSSESEREELRALARPADREKLVVIYNATDPVPAPPDAERTALRAELGADSGTVLGLLVGQLEARKAPLLAARAAVRVRASGVAFVLAVVGEGPLAGELQALQGDAVRLLGPRRDARRLMAAADLFLQPSEREGMSFALIEAMASGLAVVAAEASSNPEALGGTGSLFRAGDEDSLLEALVSLCRDPTLRLGLGERARERALEQFSPNHFLAASQAVYQSALETNRRPVGYGA
jgi:glycosyltransferase involved in cell wall biosynthesis